MYLEYLANELLLDLFEYFDVIHLLRAFHGLNARFDNLLFTKFRAYNLDFRSICKRDFENVCQQYLPSIINQITSLHLSDNEETPNLSKLFLYNGFTIHQFLNLQSLSLHYIQSFDILNQLIIQCHHLPYLTHLNMIKYYFNYHENDIQCLINNIWNLPKLTHCIFDQITLRKMRLRGISFISSSIKYLTFEMITCDFRDLSHLFKHTPYLQRISINLIYGFPNQQLQTSILSLISLKIIFHGYTDMLIDLFEHIPKLIYLTLSTFDIYCDGYEWENIITKYLPNIKIFRLKMNLNFPHRDKINEQMEELLNTFRTSFWLEEHRWFVRCDCYSSNIFSDGILYTIPYAFDDCFYFDAALSKSTCPKNTDFWSYDRVQIVSHENDLVNDLIFFSARFENIRDLNISLPFQDTFWSCILPLVRLTSINVTLLNTDYSYSQLQELLNRALHLYSLKLSYSTDLPMRLSTITSPSIRRLDFLTTSKSSDRYFNNNECALLIHSSLFLQCQVLLIGIKYRTNIIDLINKLSNLRSLICQCEDDEYNAWNSLTTIDELVQWLRNHFPSTYSISRDKKQTCLIRIWIC